MTKGGSKRRSNQSSSSDEKGWSSFTRFFCPCLVPTVKDSPNKTDRESFEPMDPSKSVADSQRSSGKKSNKQMTLQSPKDRYINHPSYVLSRDIQLKREMLLNKNPIRIEEYSEIIEKEHRPHRRSVGVAKVDLPINALSDKELISVGINDRHLLVKVVSIHLSPNPSSLKKQLAQGKSGRFNRGQQTQATNNVDRFWVQRYALFERFDEGIKLDEPSWARTPPGPICEWISGKCSQAKLIVDAFSGVGGTTIRIANGPHCLKVIANDWNGRRLQILYNNAKVYDVDRCIEVRQGNFLQFQAEGVEVVFMQPPIDQEMRTTTYGCLSIVDFEPTLDKIISKALSLSSNFIMLLPPATSIDVLCSCINKCAIEHNKMKNTCSAKIEKIYYQGEFKYILLTMGRLVQDQIKLNHELNFIYAKLQEPEKSPFYHKKLVKYLREQYGMIFLLNLVKQCEKKFRDRKKKQDFLIFDILLEVIKAKGLIPAEKLKKLLVDHENSMEKRRKSNQKSFDKSIDKSNDKSFDKSYDKSQVKPGESVMPMESIMEEEKVNEDVLESYMMSEQTQSEVSHYSYLEELEKPSGSNRTPRAFAQSFGSIEIKRTLNESKERRSISPSSPGIPPLKRLNGPESSKGRISQMVTKNQKEKQSPRQIPRGSHIPPTKRYANDRR